MTRAVRCTLPIIIICLCLRNTIRRSYLCINNSKDCAKSTPDRFFYKWLKSYGYLLIVILDIFSLSKLETYFPKVGIF